MEENYKFKYIEPISKFKSINENLDVDEIKDGNFSIKEMKYIGC